MLTLNLSRLSEKRLALRPERDCDAAAARRAFSTIILFVFLAAVVFAGVWTIALLTGFVGAIGHARSDAEPAS